MLKRNTEYNKTLDFCEQMEWKGKLYIIAPSPEFSIRSTEKSFEKREGFYNHGYKLISNTFENLQLFLNKDAENNESKD